MAAISKSKKIDLNEKPDEIEILDNNSEQNGIKTRGSKTGRGIKKKLLPKQVIADDVDNASNASEEEHSASGEDSDHEEELMRDPEFQQLRAAYLRHKQLNKKDNKKSKRRRASLATSSSSTSDSSDTDARRKRQSKRSHKHKRSKKRRSKKKKRRRSPSTSSSSDSSSSSSSESSDDDCTPGSAGQEGYCFRSVCGNSLPRKIHKRIKKGNYIDFVDLFTHISRAPGAGIRTADQKGRGEDKVKERKLSFQNWQTCFDYFLSIYIKTHAKNKTLGTEIREMLTYRDSLQKIWKKNGNWFQYDVHFRQDQAVEKFKWNAIKYDLMSEFGSGSQLPMGGANTASSERTGLRIPKPYCQDWHARLECKRNPCKYSHRCFRCIRFDPDAPPHPAFQCRRSEGQPAPTTAAPASASTDKQYVYHEANLQSVANAENVTSITKLVSKTYSKNKPKTIDKNRGLTPKLNFEHNEGIQNNLNNVQDGRLSTNIELSHGTGQEAGEPSSSENYRRIKISEKVPTTPSPISPQNLQLLLEKSNYDLGKSKFLVDGFTDGFKIGHYSQLNNKMDAFETTEEETLILEGKIKKELIQGRVAGPFDSPPFKEFHVSPIFLRPKSTPGEFRMILNLSHPKNEDSINANIIESAKSVKYSSVRDAITFAVELPRGSYTAKVDIKDAFRLLPIHVADLPKLCFKIRNKYYYDRVLPQGCSSSCALFEYFAAAIHHIFQYFAPDCKTIHYLDDFLFLAPTYELCLKYRDLFVKICSFINIPLAPHKITLPAHDTTFLGITLDTVAQQARLPIEKISAYANDVEHVIHMDRITKKQLQSIIGKLSFASAVVPARVFLRRLILVLKKFDNNASVKLPASALLDLVTWKEFLTHYNGVTFFRSLRQLDGKEINLQADASKAGFGATFKHKWLQAPYNHDWKNCSIAILEFYPIYVLIHMFGDQLKNSVVNFYSDNEAVCYIIRDMTSRDDVILHFLRKLVLLLQHYNIDLRSQHVPGVQNILCDRISRFQVDAELLASHDMEAVPTAIPSFLQPDSFSPLKLI